MKRLCVLPVLVAAGMAMAQTPAAPGIPAAGAGAPASAAVAPAKLAVIAFQVVVSQTNEFQRDFLDIQKKYEPKRQQLKALSDEIDTLTKQLQAQGATLSDAARAEKARTIDADKKKLDRDAKDAQSDYEQEVQEMYGTVAQKVYDVLASYAEQHGYTLVLDIGIQQTPVMYAVPSTNITKDVLDAYNVKSGIPAPPQPAQGAPAAPVPHTPPAHRPAAPKGPGL
jgi:outer membrane protein